MGVQAENEAAVDGDAVVLDAADVFEVAGALPGLPVAFQLHAFRAFRRILESDEDLRAAGPPHLFEQGRIAGDGDVGLREPAHVFAGERLAQRVAVAFVGKGVVIGELDERSGP